MNTLNTPSATGWCWDAVRLAAQNQIRRCGQPLGSGKWRRCRKEKLASNNLSSWAEQEARNARLAKSKDLYTKSKAEPGMCQNRSTR